MPLSPRDTIVFIVCVAVPSILCVYLTAYLRFFSPRRSDKLASHASRIADLFFITQLFVPATVLALGVWLSIEAIKLQDNPNTTKEQLNNLAIAGFKVCGKCRGLHFTH